MHLFSAVNPLIIAIACFAIATIFLVASIVVRIVKKAIKAKAKAALVGAVVGGVAAAKKKKSKNEVNAEEVVNEAQEAPVEAETTNEQN